MQDPTITESTEQPSKLVVRETRECQFALNAQRLHLMKMPENIAITYLTNELAGNFANQGWDAAEAQLKIIASEFNELTAAVKERDPIMMRDGIADVLYTVYGLAHRTGIPMAEDFDLVVKSNLTKFDPTEELALKTKAKYEALGIKTYVDVVSVPYEISSVGHGQYYITRVDGDQKGTDGKDYPNGKWLKGVGFQDIKLKPLSEDLPIERDALPKFKQATERVMKHLASTPNARLAFKCALGYGYFMAYCAIAPDYPPDQLLGWAIQAAQQFIDAFLSDRTKMGDEHDDAMAFKIIEGILYSFSLYEHLEDDERVHAIRSRLHDLLDSQGLYVSLQQAGEVIVSDTSLLQGYYSNLAVAAFDNLQVHADQMRSDARAAAVDQLMPILFSDHAAPYEEIFPAHCLNPTA